MTRKWHCVLYFMVNIISGLDPSVSLCLFSPISYFRLDYRDRTLSCPFLYSFKTDLSLFCLASHLGELPFTFELLQKVFLLLLILYFPS